MNYRKINNLVGWIAGGITYIVYLMTMEATASFWDCGEFLSCAYKIEVGHSPGAPFFMMVQRMFGLLAGSHLDKVAILINSESALMGGLTILFLFWTITHFAKKLVAPDDTEPTNSQTWLIMGAGMVGALAYTFSDTFWFSTVEAEVYATSAFFTAITFWAILKWERIADEKYADRWLVLIAYLIGISVCVHLLNLLSIPSLVMVYYYRRYKPSYIGGIAAFVIGCVLLAFVQFGVIQVIPKLASSFDIFFTNSMGLPFDTGSITFLILLSAMLVFLLIYAKRKQFYTLHTAVLCIMFIIIGYSSYIVPVIRSRADVPIDMTNPDNAISLLSYVDREQFGEQPILFGPDFDTQPTEIKSKGDMYSPEKKNGKDYYEVVGKKLQQVYDPSTERFFPRIWDNNDPSHIQFYRSYLGLADGESPTAADNFKYFFNYQMGWMWWRYFMWNYAGRQNDMEGQGEPKNGNWVSGIKFLDKFRVGDMDAMQDGYRNNEARNELYLLPFILGILGLIFQFNRDRKNGVVILILFFFTGAATGIYLNMPPLQPRERDYAFQGCTYAYAMWIGLGVLMVHQWFRKAAKEKVSVFASIAICLLLVPILMASKEWDDHDRSRKTLARATAYNTLESCAPNAVLFTYGDNDTYPLWYLQEVEHIRPDVRIINQSLLGIDWYIDQLRYMINDADAVPMDWKRDDYVGDHHNYLQFVQNPQRPIPQDKFYNLSEIMQFITSNDPANKLGQSPDQMQNYLPTKNLFVQTLSKQQLVTAGLANAADTAHISTEMKFTLPKNVLYKNDLATLAIISEIAKEGWKRPLYFDGGLPGDDYVGLNDYMKLEGVVYRLMPYKTTDSTLVQPGEIGSVDIKKSYDLFMDKYLWGGANRNDVYFDEKNRIMFAAYRINAARIANVLSAEGRQADAIKLLDHVMSSITEHSYYYDAIVTYIVNAYYRAGAIDKAKALGNKMIRNATDDINWISTLNDNERNAEYRDADMDLNIMRMVGQAATQAGDSTTLNIIKQKLNAAYPIVAPLLQQQGRQ